MAAYGPAMEVYGRYTRVLNPDGTDAELDRYLKLARAAVRDATRCELDELPLETFDATTDSRSSGCGPTAAPTSPRARRGSSLRPTSCSLEDLRGSYPHRDPRGVPASARRARRVSPLD